ncbi:uncharacterized protein LOC142240987 [Haematobia irritans]|uniref:uncharacterized protein LOC142240987 n=1 Tax=Haematobia irritans TaxID=7368 RepID=UPI003F4FBEE2
MSHLLKRTKKSCIKLMRKLSSKQIFLKRLEEEEISQDVDISLEAREKDVNQNVQITPKKRSPRGKSKKPAEDEETTARSLEDLSKESVKRKLTIHFEELNSDKPVLQSLTSKLFLTADGYEFRRLQQLRSDTASEIIPYDPKFSETAINEDDEEEKRQRPKSFINKAVDDDDDEENDDGSRIEVVFEKVKYKEDVRYLRHTPSTCSLDNYIINDDANDEDHENILNTTNNTICNRFNGSHGNINLNCLQSTGKGSDTYITRGLETHNNLLIKDPCDESEKVPGQLQNHQQYQQQSNHILPLNVSLGCITDGNYHQLFIGEERDYFYKLTPVVKWDINGNSLEDDDDFPSFDMNANDSPAKSSLRSSSTTLETWLDLE